MESEEKEPSQILVLFVAALIGLGLYALERSPYNDISKDTYDWKKDPAIRAGLEDEVSRIKKEIGLNLEEVLQKREELESNDLAWALSTLVQWKEVNGGELSTLEALIPCAIGISLEVNNGGFYQYFFNSEADEWPRLLKGMKKVGDKNGVIRFMEILNEFPGAEPSTNREVRMEQLDTVDPDYQRFIKYDNDYFENPFPDWRKIWKYIDANKHELDIEY